LKTFTTHLISDKLHVLTITHARHVFDLLVVS